MTGPGKRLTVVTVGCVLIGLAAAVAAWRDPDGGFTVLAMVRSSREVRPAHLTSPMTTARGARACWARRACRGCR